MAQTNSLDPLTNGFDADTGVGLTMPLAAAVTLFGFVFKNIDFLTQALFDDLASHLDPRSLGTEFAGFIADNGQNLVERHGVADLAGQFFNKNFLDGRAHV